MGRKRKIDTNDLIEFIKKYNYNNPGTKIKYTDIEKYVNSNGYNIFNIDIRRDPSAKALIEQLNDKIEEDDYKKIYSYSPLDVNTFIKKNVNAKDLKASLIERDKYYASIATSAMKVVAENHSLEDLNRKLKSKNNELINENKAIKEKLQTMKELKKSNSYLKNAIKNVNEQIAESIISDDIKINKQTNSVKLSEKDIITKDTDIQKYASDSLNQLTKVFEDE